MADPPQLQACEWHVDGKPGSSGVRRVADSVAVTAHSDHASRRQERIGGWRMLCNAFCIPLEEHQC